MVWRIDIFDMMRYDYSITNNKSALREFGHNFIILKSAIFNKVNFIGQNQHTKVLKLEYWREKLQYISKNIDYTYSLQLIGVAVLVRPHSSKVHVKDNLTAVKEF